VISYAQARDRVEAEMRSRQSELWPGDEYMIVDDDTLERDWGWVIFYASRLWLETGESRYRVRAGPMIVNRHDGTLHLTGTDHEPEVYVTRYETEFERDRQGWCLVLKEPPYAAEEITALMETLDLRPAELRELASRVPTVVMSGPRREMVHYNEVLTTAGLATDVRKA